MASLSHATEHGFANHRTFEEFTLDARKLLHQYNRQCSLLLAEEEREKRTKGPRTKHRPGRHCLVCEKARKLRLKK